MPAEAARLIAVAWVLLTWLYLSSYALLFGEEFNAGLEYRRSRRCNLT
jgi:uncharacterized BrkB/YihY/UPF0761 family membrane protein